MPGFDRTGPEGQGARTGRQMGRCAPKTQNSDNQTQIDTDNSEDNFFSGRGMGRGRRWGRGRGPGRGFGRRW